MSIFQEKKDQKEIDYRWGEVQGYIRSNKEKCFLKCFKISHKAYKEL